MTTLLIFLLVITVSIMLGPVALQSLGLDLDPWLLNAIAAFIGSLVAIIGSVVITLITDKKKKQKAYKRELNILKLELYNNFVLGVNQIIRSKESIFKTSTFENFIQFISSQDEKEYLKIAKELQVLYFDITYGKDLLMSYDKFENMIFSIEHKKPNGIADMFEILRSKSLESVYEFSVMLGIVVLNYNYSLHIQIPFNSYSRILDEFDSTLTIREKVTYYFAELMCKSYFKDDQKVFILDEMVKRGDLNV